MFSLVGRNSSSCFSFFLRACLRLSEAGKGGIVTLVEAVVVQRSTGRWKWDACGTLNGWGVKVILGGVARRRPRQRKVRGKAEGRVGAPTMEGGLRTDQREGKLKKTASNQTSKKSSEKVTISLKPFTQKSSVRKRRY